MPSDTRQKSDKGDENIVINFLRGSEFGELIKSIVTKVINKEMKTIHDRINQLELKIDNLVKLTPTTIEENPKSAKGNGNIKSNTTKTTDSRPTEFSYSNAVKRQPAQKETTPNKNIVRNMSIQDNIQTRSKQDDRRRRKMPIIYGSSDDNCTIKAATRYVHFHAFRLDPDLTDHDLEAYLRNRQIDDVKCTRISSKHPDEYSSFKVTVPARLEEVIVDPKIWPNNACLNRFLFRLWKENPEKK